MAVDQRRRLGPDEPGGGRRGAQVALVFTKPLEEAVLRRRVRARSSSPRWPPARRSGAPRCSACSSASPTPAGQNGFKRGAPGQLTDREMPPMLRRHLPGDQPGGPDVRVADADADRAVGRAAGHV